MPAAARLAFFDLPWTCKFNKSYQIWKPSNHLELRLSQLFVNIHYVIELKLRVLNCTDMRSPKQNEVKDVENGQAKRFKYISVHVAKHKTSGTYGAAWITVPEAILAHLRGRLIGELTVYEGIRRLSVRHLSTFSNDISSEAVRPIFFIFQI